MGCYAATLLAEKFDVAVFEEHKAAGLPVQCTGIVTQEIFNFIPRNNDFVINQARDVRIFSPNGKFIKLSMDKPDIIVDRQKFDLYFYNQARKRGVKFFFSHKFIKAQGSIAFIKNLGSGKTRKVKFTHLIGADGPLSPVAKSAGLSKKRKFFTGMQAVVKKRNSNTIDFYPIPKGFGWAVPEDRNTLRVGVASRANPKEYFDNIIKKYPGKIMSKQGGLIPLFDLKVGLSKKNVFLVGDAAGLVKATTGGGLVHGLKSAEILADSLKNNRGYNLGIYLNILPSLWLNLKMRKIMDAFTPEEWNQLVKDLNNPESKKVLQAVNRDRVFQLLFSLAVKNPRILKQGLMHIEDFF